MYVEAEAIFRSTIQVVEANYGVGHPRVAMLVREHCECLYELGQLDVAMETME